MLRVCSKRRHCEADSAYAIFLPTGWGVPKIQLAQKRENLSQATLKLGARGVARNSESDETYLVRKSRCLKTMQYKFRPPSEPIKDIVFLTFNVIDPFRFYDIIRSFCSFLGLRNNDSLRVPRNESCQPVLLHLWASSCEGDAKRNRASSVGMTGPRCLRRPLDQCKESAL